MAEATAVVDRPSGGRRWVRRSVATVVGSWIALAALVLWAGPLRLDLYPGFAQLYAFRVQAMVALLVLGVVALAFARGRRRWWGAVMVVVAVSPLPQVLPRVIAEDAAGAPVLRVLEVNVLESRADAGHVADLAVRRQADVIVLPEGSKSFAAEVVRRAGAAGLDLVGATDNPVVSSPDDDYEPHERSSGPFPTSMLVRRGLAPTFDLGRPTGRMGSLTADVRPGGMPLAIAAVHPPPPIPGLESDWRVGHRFLDEVCADGAPAVLVGDFNSTLDHTVLRDLLAAGCRDAAEMTGNGLTGTWPSSAPKALRVPIDHLLLTPAAGTVLSYEVVEVAGSDHLGTFSVLGPPTAG